MKDLISIIIPVFNSEKTLSRCLDSVLKQTYKNIEIILINDGSTDNSLKICKEYEKKDRRIKVIDKNNEGIATSRNIGIKSSKGKYIGFIDSDDFIESNMYEVLYKNLIKYNADIAICQYTKEKNKIEVKNNKSKAIIMDNQEALIKLLDDKEINSFVWNKLISKDLLLNITFPDGKVFEDLATMHKIIASAKKVVYDSYIGYHYIVNELSITKSISEKMLLDYIDAIHMLVSGIELELKDSKELISQTYAKYIVNVLSACTKEKLENFYNSKKIKQIYEDYKKICKDIGLRNAIKKFDLKHKYFAVLLYFNKKIAYMIGTKI